MKKKFLLGLAFAALAAGGCFLARNSTPSHQFTPDEIANIEALTAGESVRTMYLFPCYRHGGNECGLKERDYKCYQLRSC